MDDDSLCRAMCDLPRHEREAAALCRFADLVDAALAEEVGASPDRFRERISLGLYELASVFDGSCCDRMGMLDALERIPMAAAPGSERFCGGRPVPQRITQPEDGALAWSEEPGVVHRRVPRCLD